MQAITKAKVKQPTTAEPQRQPAEAVTRTETTEANLLARPATATPPPGGHCPEALLAPAEGLLRIWLMTASEGYRLKLIHIGQDGCGWEMVKWSDGTRYHLFEADAGTIVCDCPGCAAHGPHCAGGQGCRHARMLKALRQVVDPGI